MVIMQDALPGIKRFLKAANFSETTERHVTGFIVAFIMHLGRMSAASAGGAIRLHPRHRASDAVLRSQLSDPRLGRADAVG